MRIPNYALGWSLIQDIVDLWVMGIYGDLFHRYEKEGMGPSKRAFEGPGIYYIKIKTYAVLYAIPHNI